MKELIDSMIRAIDGVPVHTHQCVLVASYFVIITGCCITEIIVDRQLSGTHKYSNVIISILLAGMFVFGIIGLCYAMLIHKSSVQIPLAGGFAVLAAPTFSVVFSLWEVMRIMGIVPHARTKH
jgi:hypothetical protein